MINLLLLNNFYTAISYRRVQNGSDELLCTVSVTRHGLQSIANANSTHVENFLFQNCKIFSVSSAFK